MPLVASLADHVTSRKPLGSQLYAGADTDGAVASIVQLYVATPVFPPLLASTVNVCWPSASVPSVVGLVHAKFGWRSTEQVVVPAEAANENVGVREIESEPGAPVIVTVGAVVATVHVSLAVAVLPAASVPRSV